MLGFYRGCSQQGNNLRQSGFSHFHLYLFLLDLSTSRCIVILDAHRLSFRNGLRFWFSCILFDSLMDFCCGVCIVFFGGLVWLLCGIRITRLDWLIYLLGWIDIILLLVFCVGSRYCCIFNRLYPLWLGSIRNYWLLSSIINWIRLRCLI